MLYYISTWSSWLSWARASELYRAPILTFFPLFLLSKKVCCLPKSDAVCQSPIPTTIPILRGPMLRSLGPKSDVGPRSSADVIEHDSEGLTWYDIMKYDSEGLSSGKQKGHVSRLSTFFSIKHKLILWTF